MNVPRTPQIRESHLLVAFPAPCNWHDCDSVTVMNVPCSLGAHAITPQRPPAAIFDTPLLSRLIVVSHSSARRVPLTLRSPSPVLAENWPLLTAPCCQHQCKVWFWGMCFCHRSHIAVPLAPVLQTASTSRRSRPSIINPLKYRKLLSGSLVLSIITLELEMFLQNIWRRGIGDVLTNISPSDIFTILLCQAAFGGFEY